MNEFGRSPQQMITIRQYRDEDREAIWALHNDALTAVGAHGGNGKWDEDLHHIKSAYLQNGGEFIVGLMGSEIVAMGALKHRENELGEIKRMRVNPQWQGQGIGATLLLHLEQRALDLGYTRLCLDTTTKQEAALHLYRGHGYVETGRETLGSFEVIHFEKKISEPRRPTNASRR